MTDREQIELIRSQTLAQLVDLRANPKPTYSIDGQTVSWTDYVRSLAGLPVGANANLAAGKKVFADNCAVCHGDAGKGKRELGAPNLSDAIWLYGADKAAIAEGVWNGRGGVMPAWAGRLDDATIKALAIYVHSFGGGER